MRLLIENIVKTAVGAQPVFLRFMRAFTSPGSPSLGRCLTTSEFGLLAVIKRALCHENFHVIQH